ncbi:MAG TPA: hypothetical protein VER11_09820, partial [Polyangiaceae bacterium]|nr:hypothetical protein [Polyangiaceae bacterium]
ALPPPVCALPPFALSPPAPLSVEAEEDPPLQATIESDSAHAIATALHLFPISACMSPVCPTEPQRGTGSALPHHK